MTLPTDDVMHSLHALSEAAHMCIEDDHLEAVIPDAAAEHGHRFVPIPGEHLDELEERGWIVLFEGKDGLEVTARGDYWLARWQTAREKKLHKEAPRPAALRRTLTRPARRRR